VNTHLASWLVVALLAAAGPAGAAAAHYGKVTFSGLPLPGATITATQGDTQVVTVSDQDGMYRLLDLADGNWTLRVEMLGFATISQEISLPSDSPLPTIELRLLPFEETARNRPSVSPSSASQQQPAVRTQSENLETAGSQDPSRGFQRAVINPSVTLPQPADATTGSAEDAGEAGMGAADGLLINGSVNNAASSPFAQPRAFGNSRPSGRSLYTGRYGIQFGNSSWDARPYSLTGQQTAQPSYSDSQILGTFGGPLRLPRFANRSNFFVGYQRSSDTSTTTQSALMPTNLERGGDFSQTRNALGQPVQIVDPLTGLPFPGNAIPSERISPQAAALLAYYPLPDSDGSGQFNFQAPIVTGVRQDSVQTRLIQPVDGRNQVSATVAWQQTATDTRTLFGFDDATDVSGLDAQAEWFHRMSQALSFRWRYQFTRLTTTGTPYFAYRKNVSGDAGILGNNQDPVNWGPPSLTFSSGIAGLADAVPAFTRAQAHNWSGQGFWWYRGRHNLTFGGDIRQQDIEIQSQQDPRGGFSFTGAVTGVDLADFLLGIPHTSGVAFGNADKYFRAPSYAAYITDDWRISPTLSVNIGVRWEYEAPITERFGRLVNLDVLPGYVAAGAVIATDPVGPLTGRQYADSLVDPDKSGIQPRLAMAWRPVPGSSLVVRAGYGVYRNTAVYQPIATLLAQQPPLSTAFSVENDPANLFTMANAFTAVPPASALSTFAVDPEFQVGYVHSWQASVQRDFPASLTIVASYLGSKGSQLMQQFLPNTFPVGASNPCPTCPAGFRYLTSSGHSLRQAGQVQLRRRLRNGFMATVQYTFARATDDAAAFGGATLDGSALAQDWLDLDAEYGPASFDQRHLVTAQLEYTTGAGIAGGTLVDGLKGRLFKDWTFVVQLATGSGLPLTPLYLTAVPGTGVLGPIRAATTGASPDESPEGYYLNPAAYTVPAAGQWGNAGRNSVGGPAQFALNASVTRTFRMGDRLNLDWRVDATNVLNQVTFASVNTLVTSPQFGLPDRANDMRKLRTSLRVRF
jgi:hypothetical protein